MIQLFKIFSQNLYSIQNLYPATGPGIATGYCNEERAANTANKQSTAGKKEVPTVAKQGTPIRADSPAVNRSETIKQVNNKNVNSIVAFQNLINSIAFQNLAFDGV